jgi:hypothetical protein
LSAFGGLVPFADTLSVQAVAKKYSISKKILYFKSLLFLQELLRKKTNAFIRVFIRAIRGKKNT